MRYRGWIGCAVLVVACRSATGPVEPVGEPVGGDDDGCVADPRPAVAGLHPPAGTLLTGTVDAPMRAVITIVVPLQANGPGGDPAGQLPIEHAEVAVGGPLPRGLTIKCSTDGCRFAGGTRGCVVIAGTPTEAARVTLRFESQTSLRVTGAGELARTAAEISVYTLEVNRPD